MKPIILLALMIMAIGKRLQSQKHDTDIEGHPYLKNNQVRRQIDSQPYSFEEKNEGLVKKYRLTPENDTPEQAISIKSLFKGKTNFTRKKRDALASKNAGNDNSRRKPNTGYYDQGNKFIKNNGHNRHNNGKNNSVKVHYNGQVTRNHVPNNGYRPSTEQNSFLIRKKRSYTDTVYDQIQSQLAAAERLIQSVNKSYGSRCNNPFHSSCDSENEESDESNETSEESREIPPNNKRIRINISNNKTKERKHNITDSKHNLPNNGNIDAGNGFNNNHASNNGFVKVPEKSEKYIIQVPGCPKGQKSVTFRNTQFCFPDSDETSEESSEESSDEWE